MSVLPLPVTNDQPLFGSLFRDVPDTSEDRARLARAVRDLLPKGEPLPELYAGHAVDVLVTLATDGVPMALRHLKGVSVMSCHVPTMRWANDVLRQFPTTTIPEGA
jgi:hypothetical protein